MKKLNRKGFTLIELLAVIVVLAIVLVVTIPSVISSMNSARQKSFENVVTTIEDYMTKQYELCVIGNNIITSKDYNSAVFQTENGATVCNPLEAKSTTPSTDKNNPTNEQKIIEAAGYDSTTDITTFTGGLSNGKYKITAATAGSQFSGATYGTSTPSGGEEPSGE